MSKIQNKRVTVFDQEQYGDDWFPDKLVEAIAWLNGKLLEIPEEYRDTAKIDVDSVSSYAHVEIVYTRPETDEEADYRIKVENQRQENIRRSELETLNRLKAKYS